MNLNATKIHPSVQDLNHTYPYRWTLKPFLRNGAALTYRCKDDWKGELLIACNILGVKAGYSYLVPTGYWFHPPEGCTIQIISTNTTLAAQGIRICSGVYSSHPADWDQHCIMLRNVSENDVTIYDYQDLACVEVLQLENPHGE